MINGAHPTRKEYGISESTIRGFIKSMKEHEAVHTNVTIESVPHKKRGRYTLLPSEIDAKVIDMVKKMRESGLVVNYNILIAVAVAIITANDRTLLKENGGTIELGRKWCESIFKRLNFVRRKRIYYFMNPAESSRTERNPAGTQQNPAGTQHKNWASKIE